MVPFAGLSGFTQTVLCHPSAPFCRPYTQESLVSILTSSSILFMIFYPHLHCPMVGPHASLPDPQLRYLFWPTLQCSLV